MTTAAACVLETAPLYDWVSVSDVSTLTGLSAPRCQLLLTQFCLAGIIAICGKSLRQDLRQYNLDPFALSLHDLALIKC